MRKLLGAVLVALLIPAAVAAQRPETPGETRMAPKKGPPWIPSDVAASTALSRVRTDLAAGKLSAWGSGTGGGIKPSGVVVSKSVFSPTGGKDGAAGYVVTVTAPNAPGQVLVTVDARTGQVVRAVYDDPVFNKAKN